MKQAKAITVKGRVQGVGFRFSAAHKAEELGIKGFVENRPDGKVYIEAEGDPEGLNSFISWCGKGPLTANVDDVVTQDIPVQDFNRFGIK